jgi:hypothetical protein
VLPAERTAVFSFSASGELALAMGLRHPEAPGVPDRCGPLRAARRRLHIGYGPGLLLRVGVAADGPCFELA